MKLKEAFKLYISRRMKPVGDYGIEIETETTEPYEVPSMNYWVAHTDGSLRDFGIEYVSNGPLDYIKDLEKALAEFKTKTAKIPFNQSVYSSLHVHTNMTNCTFSQFPVYMSLLYLMENVLVRYCGPDRDGNLFCLKTSQAEAGLDALITIFEKFDSYDLRDIARHMSTLKAARQKYSAINYASLAHLGSVELRMHGGTTNVDEIKEWLDIVHCIKTATKKFATPNDVIAHLQNVGAVSFVREVFGPFARKLVATQTEEDVNDNLFYIMRIAKAANWSEFDASKLSLSSTGSGKPKYSIDEDEGPEEPARGWNANRTQYTGAWRNRPVGTTTPNQYVQMRRGAGTRPVQQRADPDWLTNAFPPSAVENRVRTAAGDTVTVTTTDNTLEDDF